MKTVRVITPGAYVPCETPRGGQRNEDARKPKYAPRRPASTIRSATTAKTAPTTTGLARPAVSSRAGVSLASAGDAAGRGAVATAIRRPPPAPRAPTGPSRARRDHGRRPPPPG